MASKRLEAHAAAMADPDDCDDSDESDSSSAAGGGDEAAAAAAKERDELADEDDEDDEDEGEDRPAVPDVKAAVTRLFEDDPEGWSWFLLGKTGISRV